MRLYAETVFPRALDFVLSHQGYEAYRRELLAHTRGRTLEIGIGTGLNLDFYPAHVEKLSAVEPNPGMFGLLKMKARENGIDLDLRRATAEELPFRTHSFDTVVSAFTMCSYADTSLALREILRVLKPQGRFLFLEHGLSRDYMTALYQHWLDPIQMRVGCGCHLTVDVRGSLLRAGFTMSRFKTFVAPKAPRILGCCAMGEALDWRRH